MKTQVLLLPRWNLILVKQDGFRCAPFNPQTFLGSLFHSRIWFVAWRISWNRLVSSDVRSLKRKLGLKSSRPFQFEASVIPWGLLGASHPILTFFPTLGSRTSAFASHLENFFVGIGAPNLWELGREKAVGTEQRRELSFLLFSLLFDKQEGCLITESRLKWSFYLEPFTKGIKFGLPLKKWKKSGFFPFFFPVPSALKKKKNR